MRRIEVEDSWKFQGLDYVGIVACDLIAAESVSWSPNVWVPKSTLSFKTKSSFGGVVEILLGNFRCVTLNLGNFLNGF